MRIERKRRKDKKRKRKWKTYHDNVGVEVLTDINIALHDGVVSSLVDTGGLHAEEGGLEEGLGGAEAVIVMIRQGESSAESVNGEKRKI